MLASRLSCFHFFFNLPDSSHRNFIWSSPRQVAVNIRISNYIIHVELHVIYNSTGFFFQFFGFSS